MKRMITILLAIAMLFCLMPTAAAAADTAATTPPDVTVIAFDEIGEIIAKNNAAVRAVVQAYESLLIRINAMEAEAGIAAVAGGSGEAGTYRRLARQLREELQDRERDLNRVAGAQLQAARALYLNHYVLLMQLETTERSLEAAKRDLEINRNLRERGLAAQVVVEASERQVSSLSDAVRAAAKAMEDNLTALSDLLGLITPISLGELPDMELQRITERDFETDLDAYIQYSLDVQEKRINMETASRTALRDRTRLPLHNYQVAAEEYALAKEIATRDFPGIFFDLEEKYESFLSSTVVEDAEREQRRVQGQFALGLVSRSRVEAAQRDLLDARSAYEQERISLNIALLLYEFSFTNWVQETVDEEDEL